MKNIVVLCFWIFLPLNIVSNVFALLYDFEEKNQLTDWQVVGDAKWSIEKGVLVVEEVPGGVPQGIWGQRLELKGVEFSDGTIEYKTQWVEGSWFEGGVYYRLIDDNNWYNFHISNCCAPVAPSVRWTPMVNGQRPGKAEKLDKLEKNRWYHVKMVIEKDKHQIFFDDKQVWNETHGEIKKGKVAIGTWSGVREVWWVDDFQVNGAGIPPNAVNPRDRLTTTWGSIKTALSLLK